MEDSFKVRVERLFGSRLFENVPKSSFPEASWSVTDGEVERRQWNRERGVDPTRDDTPCASAYDADDAPCFSANNPRGKPRDLRDEVTDEGEEDPDGRDEEDQIRASVGLDSTLDREDEEDEFDRAAVGKEDTGDRIYMRDVNDHGPFINYHSAVLDFFEDSAEDLPRFHPDPRADHFAANVRLNEDREGGDSDDHHVPSMEYRATRPASQMNLKPILKRKSNQEEPRPKKQVRFDPVFVDSTKNSKVGEEILDDAASNSSKNPEDSPGVPDYIRNPSKYTCYSFDTSDENEDDVNKRAFEDFQNIISKSRSPGSDTECVIDPPKSVTFTPRKKAIDAMVTDQKPDPSEGSCRDNAKTVGIAAADAGESEASAMEEDEANAVVDETNTAPRKVERRYRAKASSDFTEPL